MRYHTKEFHIRMTEKDYQQLCLRSEQTGMPKATFIRFMIRGCCPMEKPDNRFMKR